MSFEEAKEIFLNRGLVDSGLSNDSTESGNRMTLIFNKNKWDAAVRKISEMLRNGELVPVDRRKEIN